MTIKSKHIRKEWFGRRIRFCQISDKSTQNAQREFSLSILLFVSLVCWILSQAFLVVRDSILAQV